MSDFDLDAIIERETRRAQAMNAGSTHVPVERRSSKGPLPGAVSASDAPELLWPLQRDRMPRRCENCGAGAASFEVTPPYGHDRYGDVSCLMCSRTVRRLKHDGLRPLTITHGCGNVYPQGGECRPCADRVRNRLKVAAWRQKQRAVKRWSEDWDACVRCGTTEIPHNSNGHCRSCKNHHYRQAARVRQQQSRERKAVAR